MRFFFTLTTITAIRLSNPTDGSTSKKRPVTKVINLLKDMQKQLQSEAEEDQEVYEKMTCWCKTNDKEKTEAIRNAELLIDQLTGTVEELTAQSARLNAEIKNLKKELAENISSLAQAQALRTKQLAEFNAEEKDLLSSIAALKAAITVLSKHHGDDSAFLQSPEAKESLVNIATMMGSQLSKHKDLFDAALTYSQQSLVQEFLKAPFQSYAPQSGEIFGILRQMRESFQENLEAGQKEEAQNRQSFEGLHSAKKTQIAAQQEQIDTKSNQLADTDEKLVSSKEQIKDTKASLEADEQFLLELKQKCALSDKEWEERQKTRAEEITAVSQALEILSSDDAHDSFTKTFNPDFLQVSRTNRSKAISVLQNAARDHDDPRLSAIAQKAQLDAFTKVKKAIDDMVTQLKQEMVDEVKHRDWCIQGFNENEHAHTDKSRDHRDVSARIEDLDTSITQLTQNIDELNKQVTELNTQIKKAGEDRAEQNKEFKKTVHEQKETQALLQRAFDHLAHFYNKKSSFLQGPAAPGGFKTMEKNAGGNTVLQLLQQIINDTKELQAEALRAEEDANKAYASFVQETRRSVDAKTKARVESEENKAKAEVEHSEATGTAESLQNEIHSLENAELDLHKSCDFVIKNLDVRQEARGQEIEALRQAKSILSGSDFSDAAIAMGGFMQKKKA